MNLKEQFKRIGGLRLNEAGVFDTAPVTDPGAGAEAPEDPKANMAVKKFDMLLKGKPGWEKTKELMPKLSDIKQADFVEYLMNELGASDIARKKLKLRL